MSWVRFTSPGKCFSPKVTISAAGMLSMNHAARLRFGVDSYKYCVLYYCRDTNRIGLAFTNDRQTEGCIKLRFRKTGADVCAKSFTDYFGIEPKRTTIYPPVKDDATGFLVVDLNKGVVRRRLAKASEAKGD